MKMLSTLLKMLLLLPLLALLAGQADAQAVPPLESMRGACPACPDPVGDPVGANSVLGHSLFTHFAHSLFPITYELQIV